MTEFTFITANDIHISDNGPSGRIDDFKTTVLDKIGQMAMACTKLGADAALIAGDIFNIKNPAKNPHSLVRELVKAFKTFPCPIYVVEGNHDLTGNNLDSLNEQPLGVLFEDGTLIRLRNETIKKKDYKVSLVGVPYTENLDLATLKLPEKGDCVAQIALMHLYAGIKAGMFFSERFYGYDELAKFSPDIFVLGHYHVDQGIYELDGKHFINIGCMARGTLTEEDIAHHPQIGFIKITIEKDEPQFAVRSLKLKIKPANEVFDLTKKEEQKREKEEIQVFVEKLVAETVKEAAESTSKSIDDIIDSMDIGKAVKDRVMHFLQEAQSKKAA